LIGFVIFIEEASKDPEKGITKLRYMVITISLLFSPFTIYLGGYLNDDQEKRA
jgi:hypothetical protein